MPKAEGGRGKKGGLSEYAKGIGRTQQFVSQLRLAAEVGSTIPTSQLVGFHDKTQHLAAIHKDLAGKLNCLGAHSEQLGSLLSGKGP